MAAMVTGVSGIDWATALARTKARVLGGDLDQAGAEITASA
jgi:hypothetical protein